MDAAIILLVALGICLFTPDYGEDDIAESSYEVIERDTSLNEEGFEDPAAFRRLVDELGFH